MFEDHKPMIVNLNPMFELEIHDRNYKPLLEDLLCT